MIVKNPKIIALIVFITLSAIWSSTWVAIKVGLETVPPFYSAGLRFFIAFLILYLFARVKGYKIPKDFHSHLFFIRFGLINFLVGYASVYWGEQYINSGLTSVLFAVMPFYTMIFSIWLLPSETITIKRVVGLLIGFSGVVVIFNDQLQFSSEYAIYGMIAVLISPAFSAMGTLIGKKATKNYHPVILITLPIFYCSITFFVLSLIFESQSQAIFSNIAIFSIIYLAMFGTAIAFVLYFWMLTRQSAVLMSMITFVTPPLALLWGWLILDEQITEYLLLGLVLILIGIFLARK
ncbi:DMT family transporter [Calditrichota bacterium]